MNSLVNTAYLILRSAGQTLLDLLPYIVTGVIIGELLKSNRWSKYIYSIAKRSNFFSVILASLLGIVSPLCTYGTIPIIIGLFQNKVKLSILMTFLCTSSLMNPQLFVMTWGGISPEMALFRTGYVLIFGILVGFLVDLLPKSLILNKKIDISTNKCKNSETKNQNIKSFIKKTWESLQFVGYYIVIGVILGSLIEIVIPGAWLNYVFQLNEYISVIAASLLGIPLYACGGGTIPLVNSLMVEGMSMGAALSFFLVGSATRVSPLMALAAILKPVAIGAYVALIVVFSVIAGILIM